MRPPTSRVDFCAGRCAQAEARYGVHPEVKAATEALLIEVMRAAFVSGAVLGGMHEIEALTHFQNVLTAKQLERSAASR